MLRGYGLVNQVDMPCQQIHLYNNNNSEVNNKQVVSKFFRQQKLLKQRIKINPAYSDCELKHACDASSFLEFFRNDRYKGAKKLKCRNK